MLEKGRRLGLFLSVVGILCVSGGSWAQELFPQPFHVHGSQSWPVVAQVTDSPGRDKLPPTTKFQGMNTGDVKINWSQLRLSEEQKQQFLEKRREFQAETAEIREELSFLQQDLRAEMAKNPVDRTALDDVLMKLTSTKQRLSEAALRNVLSLKGLLTPEQVEKLEELQMRIPEGLQGLRLTAEQRKFVAKTIGSALRKDRQLAGQLQVLRNELQELVFFADEVDQSRLLEVQQAITEQEMAQEKARIDLFLQMRDILTPEQFGRYQKFRERRTHEDEPMQPDQKKRR